MEDQLGAPSAQTAPRTGFDAVAALGWVVFVLLLLYLVWWMPARVAPGYVMPTIEGSVATLPQDLPTIWVRAWPWQYTPPAAEVTFLLPGGRKVAEKAAVTAEPSFFARAVPATMRLAKTPGIAPTQILGIDVTWQGGSSSAVQPSLWITARVRDQAATGARTVWAAHLQAGARPGVEISLAAHPQVVSISAPAPTTTPWVAARCLPDTRAASVAQDLLQGRLPGKPQSCSRVRGQQAVVVTPPVPGGYAFFVWQPALQELVNTHLQTVVVGPTEIATGAPFTSSTWWRFAAAGITPGF